MPCSVKLFKKYHAACVFSYFSYFALELKKEKFQKKVIQKLIVIDWKILNWRVKSKRR